MNTAYPARLPSFAARLFLPLLLLLASSAATAGMRVQLPQGTVGATDRAECRALSEAWSNLSRQVGDAHSQCLSSPRCKGSHTGDSTHVCSCGACHELHVMMNRFGSRQDLGAQRDAQLAQCSAQVQAHEERLRQQRQAMEASRRAQQQQQAYQEQLNRQYASQLAAQQREQQRRQPVVVANATPDAAPRSRTIVTPVAPPPSQREAQQAASQQQQQNQANLIGNAIQQLANIFAGAKLLNKDGPPDEKTAKTVERLAEKNDDLRREAIDTLLNPNQDHDPQIDRTIENAQKANSEINEARGFSAVVSQISNDALAAIGAIQNRVFGEFGRAMKQADAIGAENDPSRAGGGSPPVLRSSPDPALERVGNDAARGAADAGTPASRVEVSDSGIAPSVPDAAPASPAAETPARTEAPWVVASATPEEELAAQTPASACKAVAASEQADCLARQCKLEKFRNHAMCSKPAQ